MARGRPHGGFEAEACEVLGNVLGRSAAGILVRAVGRDRWDADQFEKPIHALVEFGVDAFEYFWKNFRGGHSGLRGEVVATGCPALALAHKGARGNLICAKFHPARRATWSGGPWSPSIQRAIFRGRPRSGQPHDW